MSMELFQKTCADHDLIKAAKGWRSPDGEGVSPTLWFANMAADEDVAPTETQLDRHAAYWEGELKCAPHDHRRRAKIREFAARNWPVEQMMKEAKLPVRGPETPLVDALLVTNGTKSGFMHTIAQSVFPIFYTLQIEAGMLAQPLMDELVFEMVPVNGKNATHPEMSESEWQRTTTQSAEGAIARSITVQFRERNIQLLDFKSKAEITRSAARAQRVPMFAKAVQRVGEQFQILLTDYAVSVLIDGDGTSPSNVAATSAAGASGSPVYGDIVDAKFAFGMSYDPSMLIYNASTGPKVLKMPEFKDGLLFSYAANGQWPNPVGLTPRRWDVTGNVSTWTSTNALMLDPRLAMSGYTWGGLETNSDTLFETGWDRIFTEMWIGFGIWDANARRLLTAW